MWKNALIVLALLALLAWALYRVIRRARRGSACCGEREETVKKAGVSDRNRAHYPYEVTLQIGGMTCENCARRVENALNALPGTWASVSMDGRKARIRLKQPADMALLREAVRQAGYVALDPLERNE